MCTGSYTPQPSNNCNSVAKAMNVSTYSMLYANELNIYCQNFNAAINSSASLCTPPTCKTYTWGPYDTCNAVASQYGISFTHFLAWNPNFNSICRNAINFIGHQVCISWVSLITAKIVICCALYWQRPILECLRCQLAGYRAQTPHLCHLYRGIPSDDTGFNAIRAKWLIMWHLVTGDILMSTIVVHQEEASTPALQQTSACQLAPLVLCQHQQTRSLRQERAVDGIRSAHPKLLNGESYQKHNMLTLSQVQARDNCSKISIAFSITLSDFLFLNPKVYSNCTNLLLGVAYCVFPVGNIATYSGYIAPPTMSITVPPATFSPVNTANPSTTKYPNPGYRFQQLPMASGTVQGCTSYANYNDNTTDARFNSCNYVAYAYEVNFSDLLTWNPSLLKNETDCAFQPDYSYCVQKTNTTAFVPSNSKCVSVNATEIQGSTDSKCVCFTEVSGYDGTVGINCASVADNASIKLSQLTT